MATLSHDVAPMSSSAPLPGALKARDAGLALDELPVGSVSLGRQNEPPALPAPPQEPPPSLDAYADSGAPAALRAELLCWLKANLPFYAISFAVHMIALAVLMVVMGSFQVIRRQPAEYHGFAQVKDNWPQADILQANNVDPPQLMPSLLDPDQLRDVRPLKGQPTPSGDQSSTAAEGGGLPGRAGLGGGDGFSFRGPGPGPKSDGTNGFGADTGMSNKPGRGGRGEGFGSRGGRQGQGSGRTKETDLAVAVGLEWFHRHRNQNGSWSLGHFTAHCRGPACSGAGGAEADAAATALGVLPMLGAGLTHQSHSPYADDVKTGLYWLIHHQTPTGDLSAGCDKPMYAHALATLALCEAYGMTQDPKLHDAAQRAEIFIEMAQIRATGGWRYTAASTDGDTSVLGWQMMALHGARLAGLTVNTMTLENAKKWLARVSKGSQHGLYCYQPLKEATPTMTAIGMLSWQYLGMRADDPGMVEGKYYLMQNLPDNGMRNTYYWYYGTQAMHNFSGDPKWDTWNRKMRAALVETQSREGCASGSWDPESPTLDAWSEQGGRLVTTAFSTLSLEVYYRYLPIYKNGVSPGDPPPAAASAIGDLNDVIAPQ